MPVSRALRRARSPIGGGQTGAYPTARPSRPSPFLVRWDLWHFGTITRPSERPKVMCCPPDQLVHRNSQFAGARSGCDLAGCGSLWSYSMTDLAASTRRSLRRSPRGLGVVLDLDHRSLPTALILGGSDTGRRNAVWLRRGFAASRPCRRSRSPGRSPARSPARSPGRSSSLVVRSQARTSGSCLRSGGAGQPHVLSGWPSNVGVV